jgi:hypothetical protein
MVYSFYLSGVEQSCGTSSHAMITTRFRPFGDLGSHTAARWRHAMHSLPEATKVASVIEPTPLGDDLDTQVWIFQEGSAELQSQQLVILQRC